MFAGLSRRFRHPARVLGLFAALLALAAQLGLAGAMPAKAADRATLLALGLDGVICQTADRPDNSLGNSVGNSTDGGTAPIHHHAADDALCPLCAAAMTPVAIVAAAPGLPSPVAGPVLRPSRVAAARAPPSLLVRAAYPRGPPALV